MEKAVAPLHSALIVDGHSALGHAARDTERVGGDVAIGIHTSEQNVEKLDCVQWRNNGGGVDCDGQLIVGVP